MDFIGFFSPLILFAILDDDVLNEEELKMVTMESSTFCLRYYKSVE